MGPDGDFGDPVCSDVYLTIVTASSGGRSVLPALFDGSTVINYYRADGMT